MGLKNKRILITAGPTWVAIDNVRVISNTATGENGILLAQELSRLGAKVTLVLGPVQRLPANRNIAVINFQFFDELQKIVVGEVRKRRYDAVIHTAAVSDYRPAAKIKTKVRSDKKRWCIDLVPTCKIIDIIRKIDETVFLVGFKFEPYSKDHELLEDATVLLKRSGANLVVANTAARNQYRAFITDGTNILGPLKTKRALAKSLLGILKLLFEHTT